LYLGYNFIGDQGAQYLADALQKNTVIFSNFYCYVYFSILHQTLRTLWLEANEITNEGAKYFYDMFQKNKVTRYFLWYIYIVFFNHAGNHKFSSWLQPNRWKYTEKI